MQTEAIDLLLDQNYDGVIEIVDDQGNKFSCYQIALIPYDNNLYAIVVDKEDYENDNFEDTGVVLSIDEENGLVNIVKNVNIISSVFEIYDRLFDEGENQ